jgi:hypothetical protein
MALQCERCRQKGDAAIDGARKPVASLPQGDRRHKGMHRLGGA